MWIYGVLLLVVYLGANAYLFLRILALISSLPLVVRIVVGVLFWSAAIMLFVSMALRNASLPEVVSRAMFNVGSVWLVFLLYATLLTLLFDVVHKLVPAFSYGTPIALIITLLVMIIGYVNYRNPRVETIEIISNKIEDDVRIAVVSDIHLGYGTNKNKLERYVELINSQNPDIVVIVGDLIDNSLHPVREQHMNETLSNIKVEKGVYMVLGNHEYISGVEESIDYLRTTPITLLRDSVATPVKGLTIIGRDDRTNRRRMALQELVNKVDSTLFRVVLDHQPYDIAQSDSLGVDLHLSGHTHRGQVWPLSLLVDAMYDQSHGYRKWSTTHAYVSSGLSLWGPPFRIGTHSDMALITIKSLH